MKTRSARSICALAIAFLAWGTAGAVDLTLTTGGRVSLELLYSDADFRNTLAVASPAVAVAVSGCKLEPAVGLGGVAILSEKISQRGCRVDLDADPAMGGIQPFAVGDTLRFSFCAQTDADADCEFVWSSDPGSNSDGDDHLQTTPVLPGDFPGQIFMLAWEDKENLGDSDFNDLVAVMRVAADTDGDGLWDDWERFGIDTNGDGTVDLDLPALGADEDHKDIFVEIDWMDCAVAGSDCAAGDTHNHLPANPAVNAVVAAFAAANVANPDGVNGIDLHVDVSNSIPHQNALNIPGLCFNAGAGIGDFDAVKADAANFGSASPRRFAYHYGLFTHQQVAGNTTSGCGELPGNDFQVSLGGWNYFCAGGPNAGRGCSSNANCPMSVCQAAGDTDGDGVADADVGTVQQQAGTFQHELGHNLNLQHGGSDGVNFKPNYLSVMNYAFQMGGMPPADPDGAGGPLTGRVDYSPADLADLDETSDLDEPAGIGDGADNTVYRCPNFNQAAGPGMGAIDWDCDGAADDLNVTADVNGDRICVTTGPNGILDTIQAGDDVLNAAGTRIWDGPDRTCNSAAAVDDVQSRAVGNVQSNPITGWWDWGSILFDFQTQGAFEDGDHVSLADVQEMDLETFMELAAPDVVISKSASPDPVLTGSALTYTLTVSNTGPAAASSVVVSDSLPPETAFVSCAATDGGVCGGVGNDRTVTYSSIPGGTSRTVTLVAAVSCPVPDGTRIENTARAASSSPDQDPANNESTAEVTASNPPPVIANVSVDPPSLWPPNHKMRDVTVQYDVTDNCGPVVCGLAVASNEPVNGNGDGNTGSDWQIVDEHHVRLRSERAGGGSGRTYTITITCGDSSGASSATSAAVTVAHDQGGPVASSAGFNAEGTGLDPSARTFRLVVLSGRGVQAARIDPSRVVLGNRAGKVPVIDMTTLDADCDGQIDAVLSFSADTARRLLRSRRGGGTLSFRYGGGGGRPVEAPDIFDLGAPIAPRECPGGKGKKGK